MKKTKSILFIVLCLLTVVMLGLFTACDDGDDSGGTTVPPGTFVAEAEYANLQGIEGQGQSGGVSGRAIIGKDGDGSLNASNGFYVTYLQSDGIILPFDITSNIETTAKLVIRVSIEQEVATSFSSAIYRITVNGNDAEYTAVTLNKGAFVDVEIGTVDLIAGTNAIRLITVGNNLWAGEVGGNPCAAPIVDCIKLSEYGAAEITWSARNVDYVNGLK